MKLFLTAVLALSVAPVALAKPERAPTCRILFLEGPDSAPDRLHLFDGLDSMEVELPRLNFSPVYELRPEVTRLAMLARPLAEKEAVPPEAPSAVLPAGTTDFYLILTSDPSNKVVPVRMQVVPASSDQLKPGQMLWLNLCPSPVWGKVGSRKLRIRPSTQLVLDAPARGAENYAVDLYYRIKGSEHTYPLCETKWLHDPRSRSVAFIIAKPGIRTPRVLVFPDFRPEPAHTR